MTSMPRMVSEKQEHEEHEGNEGHEGRSKALTTDRTDSNGSERIAPAYEQSRSSLRARDEIAPHVLPPLHLPAFPEPVPDQTSVRARRCSVRYWDSTVSS